jgi:acetolactate synthase-1/2/3 large subunit
MSAIRRAAGDRQQAGGKERIVPTGGHLIADALRAHGIDRVFCVPGESYLALLDALYDLRDGIAVVTCRHEHGAAMMAEATGKLTGRPGLCLVTRGPGACNASIGVHTAFQDSTPMLLIVGQVPRPFLGREAFQEVDLVRQFTPLAKHAVQVETAAALSAAIADAAHEAVSGRPGPVVVAVPEDLLEAEVDAGAAAPRPSWAGEPDPGQLDSMRRILAEAERPMMIVGGGGWTDRARADILAFGTAQQLPVCCSFRRHDLYDNRDETFVGELGIAASAALLDRVRAADVVLAVGTRLGEIATQGYTLLSPADDGRRLVHVHPDPGEPGRVFAPSLAIAASPAAFAAAARRLPVVGGERWRAWLGAARQDYRRDRTPPPCGGSLDLGRVLAELEQRLPADAVVTVDAGNFSGWPQRFLTFGGGRRLLGPCNGAMGYGVPAAVAAKLAMPWRTVIACVGDGGFGMTGQEVATAVRHDAGIVVLVFNNGMYGTIRLHQERAYPGRAIGTALGVADVATVARGWGADGTTVTTTDEFAPALTRALADGRPAVIDLRMDPDMISTRVRLSTLKRSGDR